MPSKKNPLDFGAMGALSGWADDERAGVGMLLESLSKVCIMPLLMSDVLRHVRRDMRGAEPGLFAMVAGYDKEADLPPEEMAEVAEKYMRGVVRIGAHVLIMHLHPLSRAALVVAPDDGPEVLDRKADLFTLALGQIPGLADVVATEVVEHVVDVEDATASAFKAGFAGALEQIMEATFSATIEALNDFGGAQGMAKA